MCLCIHLKGFQRSCYGWVANPFPTGTCTPQDTPSFAWHTNARLERREDRPCMLTNRMTFRIIDDETTVFPAHAKTVAPSGPHREPLGQHGAA